MKIEQCIKHVFEKQHSQSVIKHDKDGIDPHLYFLGNDKY